MISSYHASSFLFSPSFSLPWLQLLFLVSAKVVPINFPLSLDLRILWNEIDMYHSACICQLLLDIKKEELKLNHFSRSEVFLLPGNLATPPYN